MTRENRAEIHVRSATETDCPSLARLAALLGLQHHAYDPARFELARFGKGTSLQDTYRAFFREQLQLPAASVLVAEQGARIVGYAFARVEPANLVDLSDQTGWVHDLFVDADTRGQGVGDKLLSAAISSLRDRGANLIRLGVAVQNALAASYFARRGFRQTMIELTLN